MTNKGREERREWKEKREIIMRSNSKDKIEARRRGKRNCGRSIIE